MLYVLVCDFYFLYGCVFVDRLFSLIKLIYVKCDFFRPWIRLFNQFLFSAALFLRCRIFCWIFELIGLLIFPR